jgi:hypothetical protein
LQSWARFWFAPADPLGLRLLRLLVGVLLLAWLLPFAADVQAFFGLHGWFDRQAYAEAARLADGPPKGIGWSLLYLCGTNAAALQAFYWGSVAVLVLFTLGVGTRLTGVLTWLVVASFTANPAFDDEIDPLLHLLALSLAVGYLLLGLRDRNLSWAQRLLGRWDTFLLPGVFPHAAGERPSVAANLAARLIQVHLAILLVATGLHKLQFGDWWSGAAYWYPLHPALETHMDGLRGLVPGAGSYLGCLGAAAYATLAWQIAFPLFAWRRGLGRGILLLGAVAGWAGAAWLYRMPLYGPAFAIGCLAFVSGEELSAVAGTVRRIWARGRMQDGQSRRQGTPTVEGWRGQPPHTLPGVKSDGTFHGARER